METLALLVAIFVWAGVILGNVPRELYRHPAEEFKLPTAAKGVRLDGLGRLIGVVDANDQPPT